ncbi:TRAP transporter large permease [Nocardia rhamnosiphila]|uniref:TRAP transporter large permease n=1 Tax=Nocardia rhamnosiphila TaxID=426716 RepID=A0ABV2WYU3_9NOCA
MTAIQDHGGQNVLDEIDRPSKRRNGRNRGRVAVAAFVTLLTLSAVLAIVVLTVPMERQTVGLLILASTVTLMMSGVHVAVAMALPSLLGLWVVGGPATLNYALEQIPRTSVASWSLSVIPMFIFMGLMISRAGLAEVVFHAAKQWIGGVPGGLGVATIFAGAGMSAASGSTLGVTYATSRIGIPEMLRAGYSPSMATGTVAMAGTLKMLIPPSITVVIYAGIAQTPVGPQLLAGVIPGAILALLFGILIVVRGKLNPGLAPGVPMDGVTWKGRGIALLQAWPVALLLLIIVGGMQSGIATATESGALAALSTILISGWMRRRDGIRAFVRQVVGSAMLTVGAVAAIMFLIICVNLLTMMIATSGVVQEISTFVVDLGLGRTVFLLALVVMYVVLGMFMDELAMLLLTVPVLLPILMEYDVNLIWFGVFLIMLCEVGMVVPPVGFLSFVVHGIAQQPEVNLGHRISLIEVFRGVFWFVVVTIGLILLLVFYPDLALWLPDLSMGD